jgi:hypothetical protein
MIIDMTTFRTLIDHQDTEIRNTCAFAIANFASNPMTHQSLMKADCLMPMVAMLDLEVQERFMNYLAVQENTVQ